MISYGVQGAADRSVFLGALAADRLFDLTVEAIVARAERFVSEGSVSPDALTAEGTAFLDVLAAEGVFFEGIVADRLAFLPSEWFHAD